MITVIAAAGTDTNVSTEERGYVLKYSSIKGKVPDMPSDEVTISDTDNTPIISMNLDFFTASSSSAIFFPLPFCLRGFCAYAIIITDIALFSETFVI